MKVSTRFNMFLLYYILADINFTINEETWTVTTLTHIRPHVTHWESSKQYIGTITEKNRGRENNYYYHCWLRLSLFLQYNGTGSNKSLERILYFILFYCQNKTACHNGSNNNSEYLTQWKLTYRRRNNPLWFVINSN